MSILRYVESWSIYSNTPCDMTTGFWDESWPKTYYLKADTKLQFRFIPRLFLGFLLTKIGKLCEFKVQYKHKNFPSFSVRNGERVGRKSACVLVKGTGQSGVWLSSPLIMKSFEIFDWWSSHIWFTKRRLFTNHEQTKLNPLTKSLSQPGKSGTMSWILPFLLLLLLLLAPLAHRTSI